MTIQFKADKIADIDEVLIIFKPSLVMTAHTKLIPAVMP